MFDRRPQTAAFDVDPDIGQILKFLARDRGDDEPALRLGQHQTFCRQARQRFAHRRAGGAKSFRQFGLIQPLSGFQLSRADFVKERFFDALGG